jgi:NAD-dependent deacetylase
MAQESVSEQALEDRARLRALVEAHHRVVFFGGAGVSTESGIPDFRSANGIYSQKYPYPPEQMCSHTFFMQHTEGFYEFYRSKMIFPAAKPNAAHRKLAQLEAEGIVSAIVTQNIDGLHQAAGSKNVLELHGSVHRNFCMECGAAYGLDTITGCDGIPRCRCGGIIKPDVVLYEEPLDEPTIRKAIAEISSADMLIVAGTSLVVYPAASFVGYFGGDTLALVNKSATVLDGKADFLSHEAIGTVLDW